MKYALLKRNSVATYGCRKYCICLQKELIQRSMQLTFLKWKKKKKRHLRGIETCVWNYSVVFGLLGTKLQDEFEEGY